MNIEHKQVSQERRRQPRINKCLQFELKAEGLDIVTETIDLSCIGAYCQVNKYIPLMTIFDITLALPSGDKENEFEHVKCNGTVVRVDKVSSPAGAGDNYNVAIYFAEIEESEKQKLASFVEKHPNVQIAG